MSTPIDDPVVRKKHETQRALLDKAHGDLRKYNDVVHDIVRKVREKHPGGFKQASDIISRAA